MKSVFSIIIMLCLNGVLLNSQPLDFPARQKRLREEIGKLSDLNDSVLELNKFPVNGRLFYPGGNKFVHPFFMDNSWRSGRIWSSGKVYDLQMLKYDINLDYLVQLYYMDSFAWTVYLTRESINEFEISGHRFRYLDDFGNSLRHDLKPGYFEILYDSTSMAFVRREKAREQFTVSSNPEYSEKVRYYIEINGKISLINNQKSLLNAFYSHRKEIKAYMSLNKLRFSKNNYDVLPQVLKYFDSL